MTPSRCPVCEGRGAVPAGFYSTPGEAARETCRSCGGSGVIVTEAAAKVGGSDPLDLTYQPETP